MARGRQVEPDRNLRGVVVNDMNGTPKTKREAIERAVRQCLTVPTGRPIEQLVMNMVEIIWANERDFDSQAFSVALMTDNRGSDQALRDLWFKLYGEKL